MVYSNLWEEKCFNCCINFAWNTAFVYLIVVFRSVDHIHLFWFMLISYKQKQKLHLFLHSNKRNSKSVTRIFVKLTIVIKSYMLSKTIRFKYSILYSYLTSGRSIDQHIFSEVLGTARCILLPEANGRRQ